MKLSHICIFSEWGTCSQSVTKSHFVVTLMVTLIKWKLSLFVSLFSFSLITWTDMLDHLGLQVRINVDCSHEAHKFKGFLETYSRNIILLTVEINDRVCMKLEHR